MALKRLKSRYKRSGLQSNRESRNSNDRDGNQLSKQRQLLQRHTRTLPLPTPPSDIQQQPPSCAGVAFRPPLNKSRLGGGNKDKSKQILEPATTPHRSRDALVMRHGFPQIPPVSSSRDVDTVDLRARRVCGR